jgi:Gpi18-like mannosyltransferase
VQTKHLLNFLRRPWILILFFTLCGLLVRIGGLHYISSDMRYFLLPWFQQIQAGGGLPSLHQQVGDYGIPYQTMIALISYLPFNPVLMYKGVSIAFDFVLAISVALLVKSFVSKTNGFALAPVFAYGVILLLPQVVMNSAVWGQCDAIYASFCILAIYFCESKRYPLSSICLGLAFAIKLQTIFLLPYFVYKILQHSKFSRLLYALIIPLPNIVLSIPALFFGRSFKDIFGVFFNQISTYNKMSLNAPSIWTLFADPFADDYYTTFHGYAIIIAGVAALCIIIFALMNLKDTTKNNIFVAFLLLFTVTFLLPDMHERYIYLVGITAIILAFMQPKLTPLAITMSFVSTCSSGRVLFGGNSVPLALLSTINLLALLASLYLLYRENNLFDREKLEAATYSSAV